MADDLMRYDVMAREALRGVVREAIRRVADSGLPGSHHFYISFRTRAPGVDLDPDLMEKHPSEMTIVLEHRFWDLAVDDDAFEVTLTFNRVPKYIRVPFDAVTQFHDPSVGFALRFEAPAAATPIDAPRGAAVITADGEEPAKLPTKPKATAETPKPARATGSGEVVDFDAFRKKTD